MTGGELSILYGKEPERRERIRYLYRVKKVKLLPHLRLRKSRVIGTRARLKHWQAPIKYFTRYYSDLDQRYNSVS